MLVCKSIMETNRKVVSPLPPVPSTAPPLPASSGSNSAFPRVRPKHGRTSGPTRRSTRGQWTPEEDEILCKAVQTHQGKNWKKIAESFKDRTDVQCLHRWQKVLNPELIKGPWSKEEDEIIVQLVNKYGPKKWSTIAQHLPGRIGKQCRERWHNHLNPAINKEAWTQEEELVLISAHQIHGNKWAELTKYLPGRTDNAIKNHWNSSVKKKLESYIASGLLAQFSLPVASLQDQSIAGTSWHLHHSNGGGSGKDGAEAEENSECSQVGCSQTASDMSNTACLTREELFLSDESNHTKMQTTSAKGSYPELYYPSLDDVNFTIPDVPCELSCSSNYLDENFSKDCETYADRESSFGAISFPNIPSLELVADSSNISGDYFHTGANNDLVHVPSHQSMGYSASATVNNGAMESAFPAQISAFPAEMLREKEGCSQVSPPEEEGIGCPSSANHTICSDIIEMDRYRDSQCFQSGFQVSESSGPMSLRQYNPLNAALPEALQHKNVSSSPSERPEAHDKVISSEELNQINGSLIVPQVEIVAKAGFTPTHNSVAPCHDYLDVGSSEQADPMDTSKLVPVNAFCSETSNSPQNHPSVVKVEQAVEHTGKQETGNLCYEPPRFPSLDIPFFSCDLVQCSSDVQQEFSPLGIRQLMMSSMNSLTPFKLWDSPSSDGSPDAVLKSAAKTFACAPSILKKRHRDLLSPLSPFSERRYDKKIVSDVNQEFLCTSRLTQEFSRLDVMFNEADGSKEPLSPSHDQNDRTITSIEDKENICPVSQKRAERVKENHDFREKASEEESNKNCVKDEEGDGVVDHDFTSSIYRKHASGTPRGVLVECPLIDMQLSSPDGIRHKAGLKLSSPDGASKVYQSSIKASEKAGHVSSHSSKQKNESNDSAVISTQPASTVSTVNEVGAENLNIFGGTPFRRSIESPSAWKSPWYFSSLVPRPRFETDITDIGFFMSPGERSVDALGLLKQINEQSADAYADAREVLGSDTPESILKQKCFRNQEAGRETNKIGDSPLDGHLCLASNALMERRMLDFSECETPPNSTEKVKCIGDSTLKSSPCLLKSYR